MNTKLFGSVVVALMGAVGVMSPAAQAEVSHYRSSGAAAYADFNHTDESGCIWEQVTVMLYEDAYSSDQVIVKKGTPTAFISFNSYDGCAGTGSWGWGEVAINSYSLDKNLGGASLIGTANMETWDWEGNTVFSSFSVDINWTGTGEIERGSYSTRAAYTGFRYNESSRGSYRMADAAGVVSDGTRSFSFNPAAADEFTWTYGSLSNSRYRNISVFDSHGGDHTH